MTEAIRSTASKKLAWLEGIRSLAAVAILVYHAQLYFTDYAYTPQPTGLLSNLQQVALANQKLGESGWIHLLTTPFWFGFQFVDVFVLLSGFVAVLTLRNRRLKIWQFYRSRLLRILLPFWTVACLSYPMLWAIGAATHSYMPDRWHTFVGVTFPLFFQYDAQLLLPTSGPWWFIPLILTFTLIFPALWTLMHRWGIRNLLLISLLLSIGYRAIAVFYFDGHPTYVNLETATGWSPFLSVLAKLDIFVCGMAAAQLYLRDQGLWQWKPVRILCFGLLCYLLGFYAQFSRSGWVVADLLVAIGLSTSCMLSCRYLEQIGNWRQVMLQLGVHSYTYFLIHNFVVDRSINLVIGSNLLLYHFMLPIMAIGTLILSVIADYTTPLIQRIVSAILRDLDYVLTVSPNRRKQVWSPQVGDWVRCWGQGGWIVLKVERLLDDKELCLCQVSNGDWTIWLNAEELQSERRATNGTGDRTSGLSYRLD